MSAPSKGTTKAPPVSSRTTPLPPEPLDEAGEADRARADRVRAVRLAVVGGLVALVAGIAVVLASTGVEGRRVEAVFTAAQGLVRGAEVRQGGVTIGRVDRIALRDGLPLVTLRLRDGRKLHRGATAAIRVTSLSGEINRAVDLTDGPSGGPVLADGATLGLARTTTPVELETALSTLDPRTRRSARRILQGMERATRGRGGATAVALRRTAGTLAAVNGTMAQITADGVALRRAVSATSRVTSALAAAPGTTGAATDRLASLVEDMADRQAALGASVDRLPDGLREPRETLDRLRSAVPRLRAATASAAPAIRELRRTAPVLRSASRAARPALRQAGALTRDAPARLRTVLPLVHDATPFLRLLGTTLHGADPILDETRVRLPDAFSFFANWADFTSNYDASGHAARVGLVLPPAPLNVTSPDGTAPGHLARPFVRTPGALAGAAWKDFASSYVTPKDDR